MRLMFDIGERVYVDGTHDEQPPESGLVMEPTDPEATHVKVFLTGWDRIYVVPNERVHRDRRKAERRRDDRDDRKPGRVR